MLYRFGDILSLKFSDQTRTGVLIIKWFFKNSKIIFCVKSFDLIISSLRLARAQDYKKEWCKWINQVEGEINSIFWNVVKGLKTPKIWRYDHQIYSSLIVRLCNLKVQF